MDRGTHLIVELDRLAGEIDIVYTKLVLPRWGGPNHGMPDTLYGFLMGTFSRVDLLSAHWKGSYKAQSSRMTDFMTVYIQPDRFANLLAVQIWRHKLMHTSAPRPLKGTKSGVVYRWLLHWGNDHLPRDQHCKLAGGEVLNLSLTAFVEDVRVGAVRFLNEVRHVPLLARNFDAVALELSAYKVAD